MLARFGTIALAALLAVVGLNGTAAAGPVVCLAQGGSCDGAITIETALPELFTLELFVESGAAQMDSFLLDELRWDPAVLSLSAVAFGPDVDGLGYFDDLGLLTNAFGLLLPAFGDSGVLATLTFQALAYTAPGATSIFFQSLPDSSDLDDDQDTTEANPFGPVIFQQAVAPFDFVAPDAARGADVTIQAPVQTAIPEPATLSLLGLGLAGAAVRRRRKSRR